MQNNQPPYRYSKRYNKLTLRESYHQKVYNFKKGLLIKMSNSFLAKRLDHFDVFSLKQTYIDKNILAKSKSIFSQPTLNYVAIDLTELHFFEVIEIDNFDRYQQKVISKFAKQKIFYTSSGHKDLKENLSKVKDDLDIISTGGLFSLNFKKNENKNSDLIDFVEVSYIKTNESYFMLRIEVSPSIHFKSIFRNILEQDDSSNSIIHFKPFFEIFKTKRFISHENFVTSTKCQSIQNLISDINEQVKLNVTRHLKGIFHDSSSSRFLPCIEYFEVEEIEDFHKDSNLRFYFDRGFDGPFKSPDSEIEVYLSDLRKEKISNIQVVKKKGHGKKKGEGNDMTDYAKLETYYLLKSLAFPCVFKAILHENRIKLNKLKRDIYDFIGDSSKNRKLRFIFFFISNRKYIELKVKLTQVILTLKRFESEFSKQELAFYTSDFQLIDFKATTPIPDSTNLLEKIIKNFEYQIKQLDKKTKDANEVFKSIEELNSYRTNLLLQVISIFIGLLALVFTFDKAKKLFQDIYNWVTN
jgi:hypothetical protein